MGGGLGEREHVGRRWPGVPEGTFCGAQPGYTSRHRYS